MADLPEEFQSPKDKGSRREKDYYKKLWGHLSDAQQKKAKGEKETRGIDDFKIGKGDIKKAKEKKSGVQKQKAETMPTGEASVQGKSSKKEKEAEKKRMEGEMKRAKGGAKGAVGKKMKDQGIKAEDISSVQNAIKAKQAQASQNKMKKGADGKRQRQTQGKRKTQESGGKGLAQKGIEKGKKKIIQEAEKSVMRKVVDNVLAVNIPSYAAQKLMGKLWKWRKKI